MNSKRSEAKIKSIVDIKVVISFIQHHQGYFCKKGETAVCSRILNTPFVYNMYDLGDYTTIEVKVSHNDKITKNVYMLNKYEFVNQFGESIGVGVTDEWRLAVFNELAKKGMDKDTYVANLKDYLIKYKYVHVKLNSVSCSKKISPQDKPYIQEEIRNFEKLYAKQNDAKQNDTKQNTKHSFLGLFRQ